ncbi:RING-finger ubiquitin ligase [Trifolium medium]|uniref:RING-finger ubiquitin ligase n=1 Tax=Trifolium medium TaxID=97028 RepID=A0A392MEY1_9FABA|nr:RING-finger ubiquitin ligase [Trifolium medium]
MLFVQVDYTAVFVFRLLMFVDNGFAAGMGLTFGSCYAAYVVYLMVPASNYKPEVVVLNCNVDCSAKIHLQPESKDWASRNSPRNVVLEH